MELLFDTPIYEATLQTCWHLNSYKSQVALMTELLRLQQKKQLPSEMTAEDISELVVEESKKSLRVKLWEYELLNFDQAVTRPLLKLVYEVNNSMKMRDVEFEARRLLRSPEDFLTPSQYRIIINKAQRYAKSLTGVQQGAPISKLLGPREVVMEVVPKVLQGFWLPPTNTSFNTPSQQLSKMAVGVVKAVEDRVLAALSSTCSTRDDMVHRVAVTRSIRDNMVLSIQEKVRQAYCQDNLVKNLDRFAAEVLKNITDVAAGKICELFLPLDVVGDAEACSASPAEDKENGLDEDKSLAAIIQPDPDVITPPPTPMTSTAAPLTQTATLNGKTEMSGFRRVLHWLQKSICCCVQPKDDEEQEPAYTVVDDDAEAETSPADDEEYGLKEDDSLKPVRKPDLAVTTPPPATLTTSPEPPVPSKVARKIEVGSDASLVHCKKDLLLSA